MNKADSVDDQGIKTATLTRFQTTGPGRLAIFAFPSLPHAFVILPLNIVIPTFYATHTTVTLAQIAFFTTFTRILDAVFDPLIGYLSDKTKSPLGRRKPWVLAGGILCSIGIFFLFRPPATADFIYYGAWSFLVYFGFTLFEIPRSAWSAELSREYTQRARISTYMATFSVAGSLVFWVVPLLLYKVTGTTEITGTATATIAYLYALLMPAGIILAILLVPAGPKVDGKSPTFREISSAVRNNKPFWLYAAAIGLWGLGQGASLSSMMIFLTDYMKLGALFPILMVVFFVVQVAAMPFWYKVIARYGKHQVWSTTMIAGLFLRPAILLFDPGTDATVPMLVLTALMAFLGTTANITPSAVLGDIIDYSLLKTKTNNAANFFAINTLIIKATMALGTGLAFYTLDIFNYKVGGPNDGTAMAGLMGTYLVFPIVVLFLSALVVARFPLTSRRHGIIRRRIERRAEAIGLPDIDPVVK